MYLCEGDSHACGPVDFQGGMWRLCHCFCEMYVKRVLVYRLSHVNTVKLCSLRLSFALVFLIATLLHRSGDVELNPGPPPMNGHQTDPTTDQQPQPFCRQHRQNFSPERGVCTRTITIRRDANVVGHEARHEPKV